MASYRLLKIDELSIDDHCYLRSDDVCYYFMEYRPTITDEVKSIIMNFKKSLDRKMLPDYPYKIKTTNSLAELLRQNIPEFQQSDTILVPIPPSKSKDHPLYDSRVYDLLEIFCNGRENSDLRDLISTKGQLSPSHSATIRPTPGDIYGNLILDKKMCLEKKHKIILFDDVITTGAHFKACKKLLKEEFPDSEIIGIFIARSV